jgi:hypothetical protein
LTEAIGYFENNLCRPGSQFSGETEKSEPKRIASKTSEHGNQGKTHRSGSFPGRERRGGEIASESRSDGCFFSNTGCEIPQSALHGFGSEAQYHVNSVRKHERWAYFTASIYTEADLEQERSHHPWLANESGVGTHCKGWEGTSKTTKGTAKDRVCEREAHTQLVQPNLRVMFRFGSALQTHA